MDSYNKIVSLWQSYNIKTESDYEKRLDNFKILFAYNSSKIENEKIKYYDTREIFENGKIVNYTGDVKTLFEQQNQKICYEYLISPLSKKEKITIEFIKEVRRILTVGTYDERRFLLNNERPGEFKIHDYIVGKNEVGSRSDEVNLDLTELLKEINELDNLSIENILIAASYFHCRFESIHPFADGNGRTGRTLLNYFIMINDLPPLIIYDEDKYDYYKCLEQFDTEDNILSMVSFIKEQTEKTWEKELKKQ